ncbi:MAG: hypothetical protein H6709_20220 [Kofleriaceae bacterium]|nr:hypothetical protein [Kofleriaceae bacterium]
MADTVLELRCDGARVILRLAPDPTGQRRALARGAGHALSHAGALPDPLRALVLEAARRFGAPWPRPRRRRPRRRRPGGAAARDRRRAGAGGAARGRAGRAGGGAAAVAVDAAHRRARLDAGVPWPFDAELAALRLGRRRIVKREAFDDAAEAADRAWLAGHGVHLARGRPRRSRRPPRHPRRPRPRRARRRPARRRAGAARRPCPPDAARALGDALGYRAAASTPSSPPAATTTCRWPRRGCRRPTRRRRRRWRCGWRRRWR